MSITDYKITATDIARVSVTSQPDTLTGTATQNKKVFDNYPEMIKEHFNNALDYLDGDYTNNFSIDNSVVLYYRDTLGME